MLITGHRKISCLYQVIWRVLAYTRSSADFLAYTRSSGCSLFIPGAVRYSHQWPGCGGSFLGQYNAEERFLGRLREWRLGERYPRLGDDSGWRVVFSRPVSGMSTTVGGRSARLTAAASGGAASNSILVSGRAAHGWGNTRPGLKTPAILSSLFGSVNDIFPLRCPTGDPEKESRWDRWRAGEERPDPEKESRRDLRTESCWMLDLASLNRQPDSGWSGSNRRSEFWLAVSLWCCGCCGRKKVRGCSTGVRIADPVDLLIPGWFPASLGVELWLVVDLGCVSRPASRDGEFWLAAGSHWVALPAFQEGELWLAVDPDCLSFLLRGRIFCGSLRGALWGGVISLPLVGMQWSLEGAGEVRSPWSREGGGAGSRIQLRWLLYGG